MGVEGSGFQSGGHLAGVAAAVSQNAAAAGFQRPEREPLPDHHAAGTLRSQKTLVSGEAENVNVHLLHIDGENTGSLGSIHDEQQPVFLCNRAHLIQVHRISGEVGAVGADDGLGIFTDAACKIRITDPSQRIRRDDGELQAFFFHLVKGPQDGIVFQSGGDHVVTGIQSAFDGNIQTFCGVGGKNHLFGILCVEKFRQFYPGVKNDPGSVQSGIVNTPAGVTHGTHSLGHSLNYGIRLSHGGGSVVKINHGSTSHKTMVDALGPDIVFAHQGSQGFFTLNTCAPGQAASGGDHPGYGNQPAIGMKSLAGFFHGHGLGGGVEGDDQFFCLFQHRFGSVRFPVELYNSIAPGVRCVNRNCL